MKACIWAIAIGVCLAAPLLAAGPVWSVEAESSGAWRHAAVPVVPDADASGGAALDVPLDGVPRINVVGVSLPAEAAPGRYRASLRLRVEAIAGIGRAWRVDVRAGERLLKHAVAYGCNLAPTNGYQDFTVLFEWAPRQQRPTLYMHWTSPNAEYAFVPQNGEGRPRLRLDRVVFTRLADLPPARVVSVWPDRVRYLEKQDGEIAVTLDSASDAAVAGTVRLEMLHDLDAPRSLGEQAVTVPPGTSTVVRFAFRNPGLRFGSAARATLAVGGRDVDSAEEFFTVHDNPWAVATSAADQEPGSYERNWWGTFYGIGATDAEIEEAALTARKQYTTCTEFFSWSPGECFDMAPTDRDFWIRGNGGDSLRSKRELQRAVAALRRQGTACITYIAFQAMGERSLALLREKPEWFTYSGQTGDVIEFYRADQLARRQAFWALFDWDGYGRDANPHAPGWTDSPEQWQRYKTFWEKPAKACRELGIIGYFVPNYTLPEVVDFCADQAIASARLFGWDGLRWDCGHLNPGPIWGAFKPYVDFQGRPEAATADDMETLTVRNLQRLKARIRAALPRFAIGTNFGSWDETHRYPRQVAELARDGGWLLDEVSYGYNSPQCPYHFWDAYYAIMADEGERITALGGHYNPFAFNRNGGKYPVDGLYETIFRIAGKGHPNAVYFNSGTPFGNFAQFCVRFGRYVFDPEIRRLDNPETLISVTAPSPLWWNKTVGRLRQAGGDWVIVHLINPPVQKEVESDPMSRIPAPVAGATVALALPRGAKAAQAWALTAESWRTGDAPRTQAVPLDVRIVQGQAIATVPEILVWKTVVLRFE